MVLKILSLFFILECINETGDTMSLQGLPMTPSNTSLLAFSYLIGREKEPIPASLDTIILWAHLRRLKANPFLARPKRNLRERSICQCLS